MKSLFNAHFALPQSLFLICIFAGLISCKVKDNLNYLNACVLLLLIKSESRAMAVITSIQALIVYYGSF